MAGIGPGAKAAVPELVERLQQSGHDNTVAVVYALGKIGPDAAAAQEPLTKALASSDRQLALASAWALTRILPASPELATKTLPILIDGLSNDAAIARQGAAEGLANLGALAKEAVPALKKAAADDEDPAVRKAATESLERIATN